MIDLAEFPVPEGWVFTPCETYYLPPFWGMRTPPPPAPITFRMNGQTAIYQVAGTTSAWTVTYEKLQPAERTAGVGGVSKNVPLFELPYENWVSWNWAEGAGDPDLRAAIGG